MDMMQTPAIKMTGRDLTIELGRMSGSSLDTWRSGRYVNRRFVTCDEAYGQKLMRLMPG